MIVVITRPAADAARTARRLVALGHEPLLAPLMEIEPVAARVPAGPVQAVVLTSANAARVVAGAEGLHPLRAIAAYPVGPGTAEAARDAGFVRVMPPAGDGRALVARLAAECRRSAGCVLHLAGRDVAVDIASELVGRGFEAQRLVLYVSRAADALPPSLAAALAAGSAGAILVYSPRSARLLVALAREAGLAAALQDVPAVAISEAAAEPLRRAGHSTIAVAGTPDEAGLLAALTADPAADR